MSILTNIVSVLTTDIQTTIISLIIGFIVYKLSKFYVKVFSLPPGPFPIPFLGNILCFRGTKQHWTIELEKIADRYGGVFTMWLGPMPVVFVSDIDLGREAFRKNDFAGREKNIVGEFATKGQNDDIVFGDYGPQWEVLRRVTHSAVQKYSSTDKLVDLVSDCVDYTIDAMIEKEGLNKPFVPFDYIHNMFLNIIATSVFGVRYQLDDPEYKAIKHFQKDVIDEVGQRILFWEMFPILRKIDSKAFNKTKDYFDENYELMKRKFESHYKDYDESVIRDFCDSLITAKNDAIREGKESAPYLKDDKLVQAIVDLFFAGTDTSKTTFTWIVFLMTYYPEVLQKLRQEIESQIGDRIPTHEDRERCHYTMAVVSEALRLKNIASQGLNHKAVVSSKIGEYSIPKGTQVSVFQGHVMHKEEYWPNAQEFRPERFLENGKYVTTRPKAYIPFGIGRRVCIGKRMAMTDLFLVLIRLIQKTSDYEMELHYSGDTFPDPDIAINIHPKLFKISLNKKHLA